MNDIIEGYARNYLKENLVKCTKAQQEFFKRMYGQGDLNKVIDDMSESKLDHAMSQIEKTLKKNNE